MNEWFGDIVLLHFVKLETLSFIVLEAVSKGVLNWSTNGLKLVENCHTNDLKMVNK